MAQPVNINWAGFSAFNNQLTAATFRTPANGGGNATPAQLLAAATQFKAWLNQVRQAPQNYGFSAQPVNYAGAVTNLLNRFFPAGARVRRFSTGPPPPLQGGQAVIDPVMVPYGTIQGNQMGIADGPSALGYMFSVVEPPQGVVPTWQNYFLPLAVLYAWAVYLAYIQFDGPPPLVGPNLEAVPRMTCVMYLQRPNNNPPYHYFLGHTKARATNAPNEWQDDQRDNALCLNYRAQMIFNAAQLGNPPLPEAAETWSLRMRNALFEVLPGVAAPNLPIEDFRQQVFVGMGNIPNIQALLPPLPPGFVGPVNTVGDIQRLLMAVGRVSWANAGTPMTWTPSNMASVVRLNNPVTSVAMRAAVDNLVNAQIANQNTQALWVAFIELYIIPRIRVPPAGSLPQPYDPAVFPPEGYAPDAPGMAALVNTIAAGLYIQYSGRLDTKLSRVVQLCRGHPTNGLVAAQEIALEQEWITAFRLNVTDDYGRCAETYPASAISNLFYDQNAYNTVNEGPNIRGFSLETRVVGKGAAERRLFDQAFDTNQLNQTSVAIQRSAYRLPCADFCRRMLPVVQMRATQQQLDDYDDDIDHHILRTVALPPHNV